MSLFGKTNTEFGATFKLINDDGARLGIRTISREGRDFPFAQATMPEKYAAVCAALAAESVAQKKCIALACIEVGCVDLSDAEGKPIAATATKEDKLTAAIAKYSHGDLVSAFRGAVNSALARTGISISAIPATSFASLTSAPISEAGLTATEKCRRAARRNQN